MAGGNDVVSGINKAKKTDASGEITFFEVIVANNIKRSQLL